MKVQKDTIGVGFIGAGDISILHAKAIKKCPGAKLVGLWNRSGSGQATPRQDVTTLKNRESSHPRAKMIN